MTNGPVQVPTDSRSTALAVTPVMAVRSVPSPGAMCTFSASAACASKPRARVKGQVHRHAALGSTSIRPPVSICQAWQNHWQHDQYTLSEVSEAHGPEGLRHGDRIKRPGNVGVVADDHHRLAIDDTAAMFGKTRGRLKHGPV